MQEFRALAAAETEAQLERFLREHEERPHKRWRDEQIEMARAVDFLDRVSSWLHRHPGKKRRAKGFQPASLEGFFDERDPADHKDRSEMLRSLAKTVTYGLQRTVTMRLSDDLKSLVPHPVKGSFAGICWWQLAEAARALVNEREGQVCEHCGNAFIPRRKGTERAPVRFCSTRCRNAFNYASR